MSAASIHAGRFRFTTSTDRWWWSDQMYTIHGMDPGDVVPTRDVLLAHAVLEDRGRLSAALDSAPGAVEPHTCEYRLHDLQGVEHTVLLTLAVEGPGPEGPGVSGFVVDRTAALDTTVAERVNAHLSAALESHAVIDQAKGVLMLTYGVDGDAAFAMLRSSSQERNVRLRALAERVVHAARHGLDPQVRERLDTLVVSALAEAATPTPAPVDAAPLRVQAESRAGVAALRVAGRVDLATKDDLGSVIAQTVQSARHQGRVLVDVRDVRPVSTALSEVLCAALRRSAAQGVTMTIVGGHANRDAGESRTSGGTRAGSAARS
ncbi:ANTAR domain-containing protein [Cellulomonas sp. URHB0016]